MATGDVSPPAGSKTGPHPAVATQLTQPKQEDR